MTTRMRFSSAGPAGDPEDAKRFSRWWDENRLRFGATCIDFETDLPFHSKVDVLPLGPIGLGHSRGSITRFFKPKSGLDGSDGFNFVINRGTQPAWGISRGNESKMPRDAGTLFDVTEKFDNPFAGGHAVTAVFIPRERLRTGLPGVEDLSGRAISPDNQALRLLIGYADTLLADRALSHPAILANAGNHLVDLLTLAYGTDRDRAEVLRRGGVRDQRIPDAAPGRAGGGRSLAGFAGAATLLCYLLIIILLIVRLVRSARSRRRT